MIGRTLGHYEITSQLGKGGMGEVYRARDENLGRDVAIKVLPEEFARDPDRVARFQREARLLASLNHQNIAAIHGLEESGGRQFLVLELVEGETLVNRLRRGPIPAEDSLKLGLQIAEALEAAHEKGIIHRDLKPANIKVTPDGKVKVLDFGLAKAFAGEQADLNLSNSPTLSNAATIPGVILGTAAYMSPEQARGKPVDKRTDIWAFGCLLYEMLAGEAAFQGEDVTEIIAAVVKSGANLDLLPTGLHPRAHEAISRCLQKDLKRRYSSITDARYEIEQALAEPGGIPVKPVMAVGTLTKVRMMLPWLATGVILAAIITGVAVWKLKPPESRQVTRFVHYLTEDQRFSSLVASVLAISPDGRQYVYCTAGGLFLRSVDELNARLISAAGENTGIPFFSPDGQWVGYISFSDAKALKKVSIKGGEPVPLCEAITVLGASWATDDMIIYSQRGKGIMRVASSGGIPETLIPSEKEDLYHPRLLPDGDSVLFSLGPVPYKVAVQSLKSNKRKILFPGDTASYLPTGHIVYASDYGLYAVPFDPGTLQHGASVPVIDGLFRSSGLYTPQYAVSASGTLLYIPKEIADAPTRSTFVWVDRDGKEEPIGIEPGAYNGVRISPDGTRLAFTALIDGNQDIYVWDFDRKIRNRLTFDSNIDTTPIWTRDGKRIAFTSTRVGNESVFLKPADGMGKDEFVVGSSIPGALAYPFSWSEDGKALVMVEYIFTDGKPNYDIGVLAIEDDHKFKPLLKEKHNELQPQISPDGRWMAYVSNQSGNNEVFVRPFPEVEAGGLWQVSTNGGNSPLWSRDGRELFYRNGDVAMLVSVRPGPTFSFETAKTLFRGTNRPDAPFGAHRWDIGKDGRFLMIKEASVVTSIGDAPRINIVLNWFEELKQKVPKK